MTLQFPHWFQFQNPQRRTTQQFGTALQRQQTTYPSSNLLSVYSLPSRSLASHFRRFLRSKKTSVRPCAVCDVVLSMDFHEVRLSTGYKNVSKRDFSWKSAQQQSQGFQDVNLRLQCIAHFYSTLRTSTNNLRFSTVVCTFLQDFAYFTLIFTFLYCSACLCTANRHL